MKYRSSFEHGFRDEYVEALSNGLDVNAAWGCAADRADEQIGILEAALELACSRVADSDQSYAEAKSDYDWKAWFLKKAQEPEQAVG